MPKSKVSVSIESDLISRAERLAPAATRSAIIEQALAAWVHRRAQARLDAEVEAYYRTLAATTRTAEQKEEDTDWATLAEEALARSTP